LELSLKFFVSLLDVDADADGDEQKCAGDDQDDNDRVAFVAGLKILILFLLILGLLGDLPVVSIETDVLVLRVSVVQHHVVVGEKGVSDDISLIIGRFLTVNEELAGVIIQSLVKGSQVGHLPVNSIVILVHSKNVLSEVFSCLI
jgi:hypothetical protein